MGDGILAREFLKDGLVGELYLGVVPVLIGEGIPLFPSGVSAARNFELVENLTFSQAMITLRYQRARVSSRPKAVKTAGSRRKA
jgi:dihydrofolate reductase